MTNNINKGNIMNNSIMQELKQHATDLIADDVINSDNIEDAHHIAFNQDYYIIGYYQAKQWLDSHGVDAWQAIAYVIEQEIAHFGEVNIKPEDINEESVVNLLVFFAGYDIDFDELLEQTEEVTC